MAKWLQKLETYIGGGPGGPKRVKTFRWLILIGLVGAALILASSFIKMKPVTPPDGDGAVPPGDGDKPAQQETFLGTGEGKDDPFAEIETQLDIRLKEMLEKIAGVGTADVMVTVDSTEETVVQLNEKKTQQITDETDKNGARRHITDVTQDGQVVLYEVSGGKSPIVVKKDQAPAKRRADRGERRGERDRSPDDLGGGRLRIGRADPSRFGHAAHRQVRNC
ncbi:stage III sporulation protein AG [Cohnella ginsengisoli]|uniref:stage III sporulation protein AG n=1 Tax=Cohnella ginsengisoli TaxID=425004 RepID=UPI0030B8767B